VKTYLYVFKHGDRLKIGISRDVERRRKDVGNHLAVAPELVGWIEGTYALEKHVHGLLGAHRLKGEWFHDCADARKIVDALLIEGPAAVNFVEPEPKTKALPEPKAQTPEEFLVLFNEITAMRWPSDPPGCLAQFAEVDIAQAQAWLSGVEEIPKMVRGAFAAEIVSWILEDLENRRAAKKAAK